MDDYNPQMREFERAQQRFEKDEEKLNQHLLDCAQANAQVRTDLRILKYIIIGETCLVILLLASNWGAVADMLKILSGAN